MYYFITNIRISRTVPIDSTRNEIISIGRKREFLRIDHDSRIHLLPTTKKSCFFVVESNERQDAYNFVTLLKGFLLICCGVSPWSYDEGYMSIYEFERMPRLSWSKKEWFENVRRHDDNFREAIDQVLLPGLTEGAFTTGQQFFDDGELSDFCNFVKVFWDDHTLIGSMDDLMLSMKLFDGNVLNEYPNYLLRERPEMLSDDAIEISYLEFKGRFELSFLCAYKGLERLLEVNQVKRNRIRELLSRIGIGPSEVYESKYLEFIKADNLATFDQHLEYFTVIRNTVAAHSNRNPPTSKDVNVFTIYEIQRYLRSLILRWIEKGI